VIDIELINSEIAEMLKGSMNDRFKFEVDQTDQWEIAIKIWVEIGDKYRIAAFPAVRHGENWELRDLVFSAVSAIYRQALSRMMVQCHAGKPYEELLETINAVSGPSELHAYQGPIDAGDFFR
jgi:hypothetical protein